jgi:VIT1/CCC1 family predicted Fe2+/Mn2+ transporter
MVMVPFDGPPQFRIRSRPVEREQEAPCQSEKRRLHAKASGARSGFEFVSGLSDFAAGAGMLIFMLAPFSLPVLALTALAAVALLIPAVVGAVLAAPLLLARRR